MSEFTLHVRIARLLTATVREDVFWIGGAAGLRLTPRTRAKAAATGCLRAGFADIMILPPDGIMRQGEIKTAKGRLSPEQKRMRDYCAASGLDIWDEWRSEDDVMAALVRWSIPLRPPVDVTSGDDFLKGIE